VVEAIAVLGVTMAAVGLVHNSAIARWEHDEVWTVAENVTMLAMPLFWLWITGRRFADYGLGVTNLKQQWDAVWACAIPFAAFALPSLLDWNGFAWLAILFIFGAPLAALYLFAFRLRKKAPAALAVAPCLLLAFAPHAMSRAAAGLMFYVFLLGPSEEVLFRGVIQSRLNLAFGPAIHVPWRQLGFGAWRSRRRCSAWYTRSIRMRFARANGIRTGLPRRSRSAGRCLWRSFGNGRAGCWRRVCCTPGRKVSPSLLRR
jgi:membrane protease YdiL (CAAX protease family)